MGRGSHAAAPTRRCCLPPAVAGGGLGCGHLVREGAECGEVLFHVCSEDHLEGQFGERKGGPGGKEAFDENSV